MDEEQEYSKRPSSATTHHAQGHGHRPASTTELMGSAKLVAGAAKSAFTSHSAAGIDKARVSEAAEDLIDAAKRYGKLEGSGFGSYLDKAEDYLHNLHSSSSASHSTTGGGTGNAAPHRRQEDRPDRYNEEEEEYSRPSGGGGGTGNAAPHRRQEHRPDRYNEEEEEYSRPSGGGGGTTGGTSAPHRRQEHRPDRYNEEEESRPSGGGSGGIGDYIKMAQGFLK